MPADYEGIATFAKCAYLETAEDLDRHKPDVAIVGAPFDISTTYRPGARFGPRALRAQAYHPGTYHLTLGVEIFETPNVVDYGDAHCPHGLTERSQANIRARVGDVTSRGIMPIVIGGDHSITWPAATAVADRYASHGTPMRRLIESGAVLGRNFVQVGLRGYWPPADTFAWMQAQSMRWHFMREVLDRGILPVMQQATREAMEGCDAMYVSVHIDVLDPGFAPGTGDARARRNDAGGSLASGAHARDHGERRRARRSRSLAAVRSRGSDDQQRPPRHLRDARGSRI